MDGLTTGLAWVAGLGLPQVLLWVLTFAVVFEVLVKLKILGRAPAAIVSVITGLFVLMAVPAAVVQVIAGMSTGLVTIAIGIISLVALLEVAGARHYIKDREGKIVGEQRWLAGHSTAIAAILVALAAIVFAASGGLALIGITALPAIGIGTWVLIVIGVAVLWMFSEAQ
jgi:hypothetical protein